MQQQTSGKPFAVVTGASSGIGYELARQFAQNGFDVLMAAEDPGIEQAAGSIRSQGANVQAFQVDLATYDGVEKFYQQIQSTGRPIDAIALNAGVGVGGDFRETDLKAELNMINLNVISPVHLTKRILSEMTTRGQGRILITSSIAGTMPAPFEAVYGATKAFLLSFAEAIRNEVKDTGVTVTALMPGATETNFFHRAGMDNTKVGKDEKDDPAEVAREGFEALMAGKDKVVAGAMKNQLFARGGRVVPDTVKAEIHRGMSEPESAARK